MRKIRLFFTVITLGLLASCNDKSVECPENPLKGSKNQVVFSGTIGQLATRAGNTTWDSGDAIGIYAMTTGKTLSQGVYNNKANVKYATNGSGNFAATDITQSIEFPKDGTNLDFVAYYPYQQTVDNNTIAINLTQQSSPAAIDLLYSNDAKKKSNAESTVNLSFKHMLSKVVLSVKAQAGKSLSGLTTSISDVIVDGSFNLETGTLTTGTTKKNITPVLNFNADNTEATITAILVPKQSLSNVVLKFVLNGKEYEWTPSSMDLESSTKYSFSLVLNDDGDVVAIEPKATIEDWTEGNPGGTNITLKPIQSATFTVDKHTVSIASDNNLTQTVKLTAEQTQSWTANSNATWLTVTPAGGTGDANIAVKAQSNTGAERLANVTIKANGQDDIVITVTQAKTTTTPAPTTGTALFPGADFEDWSAFTGSLNKYGLKEYATQSNDGQDGSKALHINGTPSRNDYVFTAKVPSGFSAADKSKITFYIKGTVAGKSMSVNVYKKDQKTYYAFNLGDYVQETVLEPVDKKYANSYTGSIDTQGKWLKVTLNIATVKENLVTTSGSNLFAIKVGKGVAWDLLIDNITIE